MSSINISQFPTSINTSTNHAGYLNVSYNKCCYGGGKFVALSQNSIDNKIATSTDGISWSISENHDLVTWTTITHGYDASGNGIYVSCSTDGDSLTIYTSPDASSWTSNVINTNLISPSDIIYGNDSSGNGIFVMISGGSKGSKVITSYDGYNWTISNSAANSSWVSIAHGADQSGTNMFVAIAGSGTNRSMYSYDGINWTVSDPILNITWRDITYGLDASGNGQFVAVANTGGSIRIITSRNGINWTQQSNSNHLYPWSSIASGFDSSAIPYLSPLHYTIQSQKPCTATMLSTGTLLLQATLAAGRLSVLELTYPATAFLLPSPLASTLFLTTVS